MRVSEPEIEVRKMEEKEEGQNNEERRAARSYTICMHIANTLEVNCFIANVLIYVLEEGAGQVVTLIDHLVVGDELRRTHRLSDGERIVALCIQHDDAEGQDIDCI